MRVEEYVPPGSVHAITVVIGNSKGAIVEDVHEPGEPTLIGTVRVTTGISCCYEKLGTPLNERTILARKCRADGYLL